MNRISDAELFSSVLLREADAAKSEHMSDLLGTAGVVLARAEDENERLAKLVNRLIDCAMDRWHAAKDTDISACLWLGLTWDEYAAWVEGGVPALSRVPQPYPPLTDEDYRCAASDMPEKLAVPQPDPKEKE